MWKNGVIGRKNDLPWYLPEDLKHFKEVTMGHTVLMGRKTYDNIFARIGKPLPGRKNVVITNQKNLEFPKDVLVFNDVNSALDFLQTENEIMFIGGATIFEQLMDKADYIYLTHIDKDVDGDVFFPKMDHKQWKKVKEETHEGFSFREYERIVQ